MDGSAFAWLLVALGSGYVLGTYLRLVRTVKDAA